jgi:hypothetical protein
VIIDTIKSVHKKNDSINGYLYLLRFTILTIFKPVIFIAGKISLPWMKKKAIQHYLKISEEGQPLDVLLTNSKGHLSNWINPGKWKHVVVYLGKLPYKGYKAVPMVAEAIGEGVVIRPLVECLQDKDEIMALRGTERILGKKPNLKAAIQFLFNQEDKPYDYLFDAGSKHKLESFCCSELEYHALKVANSKLDFTPRLVLGVPTVAPMDYVNAALSDTKGPKFTRYI